MKNHDTSLEKYKITLAQFLDALEQVADEAGFAFPGKAYFQCTDFSNAAVVLAKELGLNGLSLYSSRVIFKVDHAETKAGEIIGHTLLKIDHNFYDYTGRQFDPEIKLPNRNKTSLQRHRKV